MPGIYYPGKAVDPDSLNADPDTDPEPAFQVHFFMFVGHFCPLGSGSREPIESGSGSTALHPRR